MHITFDDRELDLVDAFRLHLTGSRAERIEMKVERLNLPADGSVGRMHRREPPAPPPLGDVVIRDAAETDGPLVVVERKRVDDLMNSLFDGRLAEQCLRMRTWQAERDGECVWTVMIIEGVASPFVWGRSPDPEARFHHFCKVMVQMSLEAQPSDRRLVIRTASTQETAALLLTLHKTIHQGGAGGAAAGIGSPMPRKSHGPPFLRQICATQGVSHQRALRVRERWTSCAALCDDLRSPEGGAAAIADLAGRLGSVCVARRLAEDLCGGDLPAAATSINAPKRKRATSSSVPAGVDHDHGTEVRRPKIRRRSVVGHQGGREDDVADEQRHEQLDDTGGRPVCADVRPEGEHPGHGDRQGEGLGQ